VAKLPVVGGADARRAFEAAGWTFSRQRGSHLVLVKAGVAVNLTIPITANWTVDCCGVLSDEQE
jgi:predicted RNA binding protein YcfA (HicA-like mRNA interferase family)